MNKLYEAKKTTQTVGIILAVGGIATAATIGIAKGGDSAGHYFANRVNVSGEVPAPNTADEDYKLVVSGKKYNISDKRTITPTNTWDLATAAQVPGYTTGATEFMLRTEAKQMSLDPANLPDGTELPVPESAQQPAAIEVIPIPGTK